MRLSTISVLIADDHPLMRDAIRACLEDDPGIRVACEVNGGQAAVAEALRQRPDVLLLDLYLPDLDGISALQAILEIWPQARALIFTSSTDEANVARAMQAGALGYLMKDSPREEILAAIREVAQGRSYFSTAVAKKLASALRHKAPASTQPMDPLTRREEEILRMVGEGSSNVDIARALHIGETTVRTHIYHLLQKMGLKNRAELMRYLLQRKHP